MRRKSRSRIDTLLWSASIAVAASCAILGWQVQPVETAAFTAAAVLVVGLRLLQARWERFGDPLFGRIEQPSALFQRPVLIPIETKRRRARRVNDL
jgi:hypothetical protein